MIIVSNTSPITNLSAIGKNPISRTTLWINYHIISRFSRINTMGRFNTRSKRSQNLWLDYCKTC